MRLRRWVAAPIARVGLLPREEAAQDWFSPQAMAARRSHDARLIPTAVCIWGAVAMVVGVGGAGAWVPAGLGASVLLLVLVGVWSRRRQAASRREMGDGLVLPRQFAQVALPLLVAALASGLAWWRTLLRSRQLRLVTDDRVELQVLGVPRVALRGDVRLQARHSGGAEVEVRIPSRLLPEGQDTFAALVHPGSTVATSVRRTAAMSQVPGGEDAWNTASTASAPMLLGETPILYATRDVVVLAEPRGVWAISAWLRSGLRYVAELLPGEGAQLLAGMTIGDTSMQLPQVQEAMRNTGLSHLSAVSGANVLMVLGAVIVVCTACGVHGVQRAGWLLAALVGFVFLVGPEPSVLRAAAMGLVGVVALLSGRWADCWPALAVAVSVLLFIRPQLAVEYAFVLSVVATIGIVVIAPLLARVLLWSLWKFYEQRNARPVHWQYQAAHVLATAVVADWVTIPIIVQMLGRVPLSGILANLLVTAVVPMVTISGLVLAPLGGVVQFLPTTLSSIADAVLWIVGLPAAIATWWVVHVAQHLQHVPMLRTGEGVIPAVVAAVLVGSLLVGLLTRRGRALLGLVMVGMAGLWGCKAISLEPVNSTQPGSAQVSLLVGKTIDLSGKHVVLVESTEAAHRESFHLPPSTVFVVTSCGPPSPRPTFTQRGQPVLFPCRDRLTLLGT